MDAGGENTRFALYLSGDAHAASAMLDNIRRLLGQATEGRYSLEVIDVQSDPESAERAHIAATPTLIILSGKSQRRLIGEPERAEQIHWLTGAPPAPPPQPPVRSPAEIAGDAAFQLHPDGLLLLAEDGAVLAANNAGLRMMRIASAVALHDVRLLPSDLETLELTALDGRPMESRFAFSTWNGRRVTLLTLRDPTIWHPPDAAAPVHGEKPAGESPQVHALISEQSALKEVINQLRGRISDAEEKFRSIKAENQELENFAYSFAHDAKAPLRTIKSCIDLIAADEQDRFSDDGKAWLAYVAQAVARLNVLLEKSLEYANSGKENTVFGVVDLNAVLTWVFSDLDTEIKEADAQIEVQSLPNVIGASTDLYRLFLNLIHNAVKYRDAARPLKISVQCDQSNEPGDADGAKFVKIKVIDNGVGFEPDLGARIFEPFTRLEQNRNVTGSGIGLATVKKIALLHGGMIRAEGRVGLGATFHVHLLSAAPNQKKEGGGSDA